MDKETVKWFCYIGSAQKTPEEFSVRNPQIYLGDVAIFSKELHGSFPLILNR